MELFLHKINNGELKLIGTREHVRSSFCLACSAVWCVYRVLGLYSISFNISVLCVGRCQNDRATRYVYTYAGCKQQWHIVEQNARKIRATRKLAVK
jgi:hypothetical protein